VSCCVKVMSWLTCVCIGACLYEFLLYTACLVLHICIYAHLHAHSARALVRALAQASWVKEVYLGAKAKTLSQERTLSQAKTFQHLAVALRHSWCLPQPICSKAVRVSWRVIVLFYILWDWSEFTFAHAVADHSCRRVAELRHLWGIDEATDVGPATRPLAERDCVGVDEILVSQAG